MAISNIISIVALAAASIPVSGADGLSKRGLAEVPAPGAPDVQAAISDWNNNVVTVNERLPQRRL